MLFNGTPGFFALRPVTPWLWPGSSSERQVTTTPARLKSTLERIIDFDRINSNAMRLSVGAVNVRTGNFAYFDTTKDRIRPEHIMASGALPPAFAAVEVDGEYYWDGGLVSNTPLRWVVDEYPQRDTLVFQVDLWSSRGELPHNMTNVNTRQKEIIYSSRTRAASTHFAEMQSVRNSIAELCCRNCRQNWRRPGMRRVAALFRAQGLEPHSDSSIAPKTMKAIRRTMSSRV